MSTRSSSQDQTKPKRKRRLVRKRKSHTATKDFKIDIGDQFGIPNFILESSSDENYTFSDDNSPQSPHEDIESLYEFYEQESLKELSDIIPSVKIVLTSEIQEKIGLEIEPNLSSGPWKQSKKQVIQNYFPEVANHFELDRLLLVGYPQTLSKNDGTFLVFDDTSKANRASELIRRLEGFHRRKVRSPYDKAKFDNTAMSVNR